MKIECPECGIETRPYYADYEGPLSGWWHCDECEIDFWFENEDGGDNHEDE